MLGQEDNKGLYLNSNVLTEMNDDSIHYRHNSNETTNSEVF
jgi:hypothetical protein